MLNEARVYEATRSFLAVMLGFRKEFRVNQNAFCRAVRRLEGNTVASAFYTAECPSGLWSADFDRGLSMAQEGCIGYHVSPAFDYFHILISPRGAKKFLAEEPNPGDAVELVETYLEELDEGRRRKSQKAPGDQGGDGPARGDNATTPSNGEAGPG